MTDPSAGDVGSHHAARVEARVQAVVNGRLRDRGWSPRVVPHVGYGAAGWVRVLARVVLAPPGRRDEAQDARGWRRFLSASAAGVPVTITVGGRTHVVTSLRDGYVDVRVPSDLEPGWHTAHLSTDGSAAVEAPLRVVGPATRLGLVSDIDDTVMVTLLPRPLLALRNAFLLRESSRQPVPGMAALYDDILAADSDVFVVYLSTGAWNTAAALTRFLQRHGFPPGPLLLTDWGPTSTGWFRSGREHKRAQLRGLFEELPDLRWLLVGDDGQHDPSIYGDAARRAPERVIGVAIRQLSAAEQIVSTGTRTPKDRASMRQPSRQEPVTAPDGFGLRDRLRERGLVLGTDD